MIECKIIAILISASVILEHVAVRLHVPVINIILESVVIRP